MRLARQRILIEKYGSRTMFEVLEKLEATEETLVVAINALTSIEQYRNPNFSKSHPSQTIASHALAEINSRLEGL